MFVAVKHGEQYIAYIKYIFRDLSKDILKDP